MKSYKLQIHPFAEFDIKHAKEWYNLQTDNLGIEFVAEIEKLVSQIIQNPKQFPRIERNIRKAAVKRFPYSFFFCSNN